LFTDPMAVPKKKVPPTHSLQIAYKGVACKEQHPRIAADIAEAFKIGPVAARILAARGFRADTKLKNYIDPTLKEGLPDPSELKNLAAACDLIAQVHEEKGKIAICCDFDVDGLSGGAQVHHFFETAGIESKVFVPDRFVDGYGLNRNTVEAIAKDGFKLLITIDFGTRNGAELELAKSLGLKTIVVDHHHVGDTISPADVFINPNQPDCGFAEQVLCASGLAWYLIVGLKRRIKSAAKIDSRSYLDLACLGTICDMVPLIGANRVIAKRGLELLATTARPGLQALKNVIGINNKVSCSHVSFGIGPRLNAAGRMVHGEVVIDLLTSSESGRTAHIARQLNQLNIERQDAESQVKDKAIKQMETWEFLPAGIVVQDAEFHTGVIGIVAQRLVELFYRPTAVLGLDKKGVFKGSVRGIRGFNVVNALAATSEHLIKFGGHEGAGGFSVEEKKYPKFVEAFIEECERQLQGKDLEPRAEADTEVGLEEVTVELVNELDQFAPFGMGNPGPLLLAKNLRVVDLKILKETHLKVILTDGKRYLTGLMWRQTNHPALKVGKSINAVFRPDISNFGGMTELQANLQAVEGS
jgi:single-stranded-DNA-specific exonuclease